MSREAGTADLVRGADFWASLVSLIYFSPHYWPFLSWLGADALSTSSKAPMRPVGWNWCFPAGDAALLERGVQGVSSGSGAAWAQLQLPGKRAWGEGCAGKQLTLSGLESNRIKLIAFKNSWLCQCTQSSLIKCRETQQFHINTL